MSFESVGRKPRAVKVRTKVGLRTNSYRGIDLSVPHAVAHAAGLRRGATVAVEVGEGADAGWLRIRSGPGPARVAKERDQEGTTSYVDVRIGALLGRLDERRRVTDVEHKIADGSLLVRLPEWACQELEVVRAAVRAAAADATKTKVKA